MGRVRTKYVRNVAEELLSKYFNLFTTDYETNKKILKTVADIPSKKLRNVIAGYITHLVKLIKETS